MKDFIIVNRQRFQNNEPKKLKLVYESIHLSFYTNEEINDCNKEDINVFILGYIVPRNAIFECYKDLSQLELIQTLIKEYGDDFIMKIKGIFTIITIKDNIVKIFSDHFGISKFFYYNENFEIISNSVTLIKEFTELNFEPDSTSIAIKSLLHKSILKNTTIKDIFQSEPASCITISPEEKKGSSYWNYQQLLENNPNNKLDFVYFSNLIKENFQNFNNFLKPQQHLITLTGGKDSRTGLAALMAIGIDPIGFTYGNPNSRDSIFAKKLATAISIKHQTYPIPNDENFYDTIAIQLNGFGNPEISIYRSLRLNAFWKVSSQNNITTAYYAGNMAGEFLMGIYYDNLIFTEFLTHFWDTTELLSTSDILKKYFHKKTPPSKNLEIIKRLSKLNCLNTELTLKERQFHGIFEIGILHHSQDLFLANQNFNYVYPFFIDLDFLDALFKSRFSFLHTDNKTKNLLNRYKLFEFNLNIQNILYKKMNNIPFGKRGSYTTKEFLKGKYYWTFVKSVRYLFQRQKFPASNVYDQQFYTFLIQNLKELEGNKNHILHQYYDISLAIEELNKLRFPRSEKTLHRFSNIVMLYLQLK